MVSSFVAELSRRLRGRSTALAMPLTWIEQLLARDGLTINQLVQSENQQQAADQVSISNSIGSLRLLSAMNWLDFVEDLSIVEQIVRTDVGDVYGRMDFATRDRYRHVAERIAKTSPLSEDEVARLAVRLARESADELGYDARAAHIGFYLIDKGLPGFEKMAGVRRSIFGIKRDGIGRVPLGVYVGSISLLRQSLPHCYRGRSITQTHRAGCWH